jgi:hypothetical protein
VPEVFEQILHLEELDRQEAPPALVVEGRLEPNSDELPGSRKADLTLVEHSQPG